MEIAMRPAAWLPLACALLLDPASAAAQAQPTSPRLFTVEDLLGLEDVGRVAFSPDNRWLAVETFGPWKSAPSFDHNWLIPQTVGRLVVVDLKGDGPPRPLLVPEPGTGHALGAFSPDGRRVIVYRLRDHVREMGVVTLATGAVIWSGRPVEPAVWSASARWRNDHEVVALTKPPQTASLILGRGWQTQARIAGAWAAAARGELTVTAVGSGRYGGLNPPAPDAELIAFDADRGTIRSLGRGAFVDLSLSPDGRAAALVEEDEMIPATATSVLRNSNPNRRRRLVFVDLDRGGRTLPCPTCDLAPYVWAWSADGRTLVACARTGGDGWSGFRYWRFTPRGAAAPLSADLRPGETGGFDPRPLVDAAWLGGDPLVLGRPGGDERIDWWRIGTRGPVKLTGALAAPEGRRLAASPAGLLLRTRDGAYVLTAGQGPRRVADLTARLGWATPPPGDTPAAVLAEASGHTALILADGRRQAAPDLPPGARPLAVAPDGRVAALVKDAHGVGVVALLAPDGSRRDLATINAALGAVNFAVARPVTHKDPDGETLTSWLYLPAGHGAADDRPVIVVPYPGSRYPAPPPENQPAVVKFSSNVQLMVAAGYAVLVPSLPLAPGHEPMPGLADAMLAAFDAARVQYPGLSPTHLAVWGQSYGGYGALAAATQSPRFKAVIASAPITNLLAFYGSQPPTAMALPEVALRIPGDLAWSETGQGAMGGPPWADPQKYLRNSPGLHTDRITAPVLLIYGDLDFDIDQVNTVFASLYRQGKDAQLLLYGGEGHVIIGPDNVRDLYGRAFAFLHDALAPSPEPPPPKAAITGSDGSPRIGEVAQTGSTTR
jgi:dipeptidyl aminopeptidase/acylaminoacyl peptidase